MPRMESRLRGSAREGRRARAADWSSFGAPGPVGRALWSRAMRRTQRRRRALRVAARRPRIPLAASANISATQIKLLRDGMET